MRNRLRTKDPQSGVHQLGSSQAAAMPAAEKEPEVWIANPVGGTDHPYVRAVMVATDDRSAAASNLGARCVVRPVGGGPEVQLHTSEVHPCNPSGHRPDNTQLLYLNEPCVIENIAHRYEELVLAAAYRAPATATASPFPLTLAPSPPPSRRSTRGPPASSSRSTLTRRSATCTASCTYALTLRTRRTRRTLRTPAPWLCRSPLFRLPSHPSLPPPPTPPSPTPTPTPAHNRRPAHTLCQLPG